MIKCLERNEEGGDRTSLAKAAGVVGNGVVGGGVAGGKGVLFVVVGVGVGVGGVGSGVLLVLGEIVHANALPHGVHHHPHAEQHDLAGAGDGGVGGERHPPLAKQASVAYYVYVYVT